MPKSYYNENDPYAAQWLRNLIDAGHIAPGVVDTRSIADVRPDDIKGYTQAHFFAGIGGWSLAARLAGWPDDRPVWTGSCPCQGFSAAGKQGGFDDDRHLWPVWFDLIRECRPGVVFGEQVASPLALAWLDLVQADMEGADYAFAALDLCSAGVGAPHIRQRLGFVAESDTRRCGPDRESGMGRATGGRGNDSNLSTATENADSLGFVADALPAGRPEGWTGAGRGPATGGGTFGELADSERTERPDGQSGIGLAYDATGRLESAATATGLCSDMRPGPVNGFWQNADWLLCRDDKWRPVESGTFPLVNRVSGRVELVRTNEQTGQQESHLYSRTGALRGYGNAINPRQFAEFIGAYLECRP